MLDQLCTLHYVLEIVSMNSHCPSCFYYLRDLSDRNQTSPGDVMIIQYWRRLPLSNVTAQKTLSRCSNRFFCYFLSWHATADTDAYYVALRYKYSICLRPTLETRENMQWGVQNYIFSFFFLFSYICAGPLPCSHSLGRWWLRMTLISWLFLWLVLVSDWQRECLSAAKARPVSLVLCQWYQWCDSLWKRQGFLGMFTKHGKPAERCHHPHSHRGCKKKKPAPHTPWKYLMNCPLVRKCFGTVFIFHFILFSD